MGPQRGLDLAEFDAVAADLDLAVDPAEVFEGAVGELARQVAGAVEPGAGRAERVRDEALRREVGAALVAAGQPDAAEVQLAGNTLGHRVPVAVQDVGVGVGQRDADGDGVGAFLDLPEGGPDGGLGRTVDVDQALDVAEQFVRQVGRAGLTADESGHGVVVEVGREQQPPAGGGELDVRHPVGVDQLHQGLGVLGLTTGGQHDPAAGDQRQEEFQAGDVEGDRGRGQPGTAAGPDVVPDRGQQVVQRLVGDHDALGPSGGPGGVEDVGQSHRVGAELRCRRGMSGDRQGVGVDQDPRAVIARIGDTALGDQDHGRRVVEHVGASLGGQGGVDGDVGGPGLPDGEHGGEHVGSAVQADTHGRAGDHAGLAQVAGQAVGALVQLLVGPPLVAADHRDRPRRGRRPGPEQIQSRCWVARFGVVPGHEGLLHFG